MDIALHMGTLRGHGTANVGRSLLTEFANQPMDHKFHVWIPHSWREANLNSSSSIVELHTFREGTINKFFGENISIRKTIRRRNCDVLFSLGDTSLLYASIPHLLMIQQPYLAYGPEERGFPMSSSFAIKILFMEEYLRLVLKSVSMITVQTHSMKRRLSDRWGISPDMIAVIPSAIDPKLAQWATTEPRSSESPYVCYIASASPHKNHVVLADMMASLSKRYQDLRCKVTVTQEQVLPLVQRAQNLGVIDKFDFLGSVTFAKAFHLMGHAVALVMPSKLESFGIPYYEAMAIGCPIVAADRDFAREACGRSGLYAHPDEGAEFADLVDKILCSNEFRHHVSQCLKKRFKEVAITWTDVASQYIVLMENLLENGKA